ncbi:hypothetical protein F4775DRAFT_405975 [Biscogniauxia sp. FL1348]|nr:hypothetical protein F4775DRAFT_405975 [Biscogniauxia sp. FL1348]
MSGEPSIHSRGQPPAHLPAENGVHVWRTAVVMPFISFLFVSARFYSRYYIVKKKFTLDDCTSNNALPSLACLDHVAGSFL